MAQLTTDAYSPKEIAGRIAAVAQSKGALDVFRLLVLAVLAGVFIGFGANFFTMVVHETGLALGLTKLIGGFVFSLGLILVVLAGAELFTGNMLMVMGFVDGAIGAPRLLRSWSLAYIGNFAGSLLLVVLVFWSRQWAINGAAVGAKALLIANAKVNLTFAEGFTRGILANALVCLAVWLCFGARSVTDKIHAIIFPITAFVAAGFEHSVANMYFVPLGIALKSDPSVLTAAEAMAGGTVDLAQLTWAGFVVRNLVPVTLGNMVGGGLLVGIVYWSIYLREFSFRSIGKLAGIAFRLVFFVNPRTLSPRKISANLSGLRAVAKKRKGSRPVPRDLTTLVDEDED
ncbi:MAG: formate/nitrite transporter family protein [Candidatus Bipolaricaulota bacterium]|nr:MAG: formate/nitrite transporter family protein [Candidatus Bipolaricaulota bacterium]